MRAYSFVKTNMFWKLFKDLGMEDTKMVCGPIVPGSKLSKEVKGDLVDATRYKQLVGSLMYLTTTPLDLMFVVSSIRRYMEKPAETHMAEAKRII